MENRTICLLQKISQNSHICGSKINKDIINKKFVGNNVEILETKSFKRNFLPVQVLLLALPTGVKYKSQNFVLKNNFIKDTGPVVKQKGRKMC